METSYWLSRRKRNGFSQYIRYIMSDSLVRLHDIGVKVVSVTLDSSTEHFAALKLLGAKFDMPNPQLFSPHSSTKENIYTYVIFDLYCHMLKLARNCLG